MAAPTAPPMTPPADTHSVASLRVVGLITFAEAVEYTIIVPTLYTYILRCGGGLGAFSFCFAAFSLTSTLVRPVVAWCAEAWGYRVAYSAILSMAGLGNLGYLLADYLPPGPPAVAGLVIGRLLVGFLGGAQTLMNGYIVDITHGRRRIRTTMLCNYNMIKMIGICMGPAFNIVCSFITIRVGGRAIIDPLNSPGLVLCILSAVLLALALRYLEDPAAQKRIPGSAFQSTSRTPGEATQTSLPPERVPLLPRDLSDRNSSGATVRVGNGTLADCGANGAYPNGDQEQGGCALQSARHTALLQEPRNRALSIDSLEGSRPLSRFESGIVYTVCGMAIFTLFFSVGVLEAMIAPICTTFFHWSATQISIMMAALTLVLLPVAALINFTMKRNLLSDRDFLVLGAFILLVSQCLICLLFRAPGMRPWRYIVALLVYELSFPMLNAPARSLFSRVPSSKEHASGVGRQGVLGFVNGVGQMLGPLWFSATYREPFDGIPEGRFLLGTTLGLMGLTAVLLGLTGAYYSTLKLDRRPRKPLAIPSSRGSILEVGNGEVQRVNLLQTSEEDIDS